ncbi:endonuclease Q family protein [Bacillus spongiae]|uniref:Endonuclease Q family protein n=1 Tax=Bacillus spongiae TaxID=2683610 RepID=A0ABU8HD40_9BACI
MRSFIADLHIHIGRTYQNNPVKITASKEMRVKKILEYARYPKGIDIVGIIDCHSPEVIEELQLLLNAELLQELQGGGFRYHNGVTLIPGCEMEINDHRSSGPVHVLSYFPTLMSLKKFSKWYTTVVKNPHLSTQRINVDGITLQHKIKEYNGLFIPAHIFTPFKSLYGKGVKNSLTEMFSPDLIDAVELGLSANTKMAGQIGELQGFAFLSNSDAHSLGKMAREYTVFRLENASFEEIQKALSSSERRSIIGNYGLNPLLGKYYESTCKACGAIWRGGSCEKCGGQNWIKGVKTRISELKRVESTKLRPPYIHQIPLENIPGIGKKTRDKLLSAFKSEMNILHHVTEEQLRKVIPDILVHRIIQARNGKVELQAGGGGRYGKWIDRQ